jgi:hypothetical protein
MTRFGMTGGGWPTLSPGFGEGRGMRPFHARLRTTPRYMASGKWTGG